MKPFALFVSRTVFAIVFAMMFMLPVLADADRKINKDSDNLAIEGYDTVAYFTDGRPMQGIIPCILY